MRRRDLVDYGLLSVIWGVSFVFVLRAVEAFGWIGAVTFRALIAAAVLVVLAGLTRRHLDFGAGWWRYVVVGATTVAGQLVGLSFATPRIGTAMAAIFVGAIPLFSMLIGRLWGLEHLTRAGRVGLVLGFVGIMLLVGFPAVPWTTSFALGCLAMVASAFSAAFGSNYARAKLQGVGSWEVTIGAFLSAGVLTVPLLLLVPVPTTPRPVDYGYLLTLGAVMSALTYVLYFRLVADLGATKAISVEFLVTAIAVAIGALILHERLSMAQVMGGVVIVLGCALVLGLLPRPTSDEVEPSEAR